MARIGRGAFLPDWRARGIVGVQPVVTVGAQAAELTEPERGVVPSMRHDMVGDGCRRDAAGFQAQPAQRLDHELIRSAACPASSAIPPVDIRTMRHRGQGLPVFLHFPSRESTVCQKQTRLVCRTPRILSSMPEPAKGQWACQTNARLCGTRGPVFYTFRKSLLLSKPRDVAYRQRKCLGMLACGTFGVDLKCSEIAAWGGRRLPAAHRVSNFNSLSPGKGCVVHDQGERLPNRARSF